MLWNSVIPLWGVQTWYCAKFFFHHKVVISFQQIVFYMHFISNVWTLSKQIYHLMNILPCRLCAKTYPKFITRLKIPGRFFAAHLKCPLYENWTLKKFRPLPFETDVAKILIDVLRHLLRVEIYRILKKRDPRVRSHQRVKTSPILSQKIAHLKISSKILGQFYHHFMTYYDTYEWYNNCIKIYIKSQLTNMSRNSSKACYEWLSVKFLQFMSCNSVNFVIKRADFSPCSLNGFQNMCFIPICWELFISWGEKTVAVGSSQNRDEIYYIKYIIFDRNYLFNFSWIHNNV